MEFIAGLWERRKGLDKAEKFVANELSSEETLVQDGDCIGTTERERDRLSLLL
jgi:hypothetical protein